MVRAFGRAFSSSPGSILGVRDHAGRPLSRLILGWRVCSKVRPVVPLPARLVECTGIVGTTGTSGLESRCWRSRERPRTAVTSPPARSDGPVKRLRTKCRRGTQEASKPPTSTGSRKMSGPCGGCSKRQPAPPLPRWRLQRVRVTVRAACRLLTSGLMPEGGLDRTMPLRASDTADTVVSRGTPLVWTRYARCRVLDCKKAKTPMASRQAIARARPLR